MPVARMAERSAKIGPMHLMQDLYVGKFMSDKRVTTGSIAKKLCILFVRSIAPKLANYCWQLHLWRAHGTVIGD